MNQPSASIDRNARQHWLQTYYYVRAAFAGAWLLAALYAARHSPALAALLLLSYPAWDAFANLADARRSGGLAVNRSQAGNALVSLAVATGVAWALPDMHKVLAIFGAWAMLAGLLQLGTALGRRKRVGAQWAMMLSGAQSAVAGAVFIYQARQPGMPTIATVAGYAGFGAFYFLVAALQLSVAGRRAKAA